MNAMGYEIPNMIGVNQDGEKGYFMIHTYFIKGMTCENCSSKIKKALLDLSDIISVDVNLKNKEVNVEMSHHVDLGTLNQTLKKVGNYSLSEKPALESKSESGISKFVPLISIFTLIILFTALKHWQRNGFDLMEVMSDFMGGFFVVFGAFKIINWKGFVESYSTYDILAKKSTIYAYLYPLIEIGLGLAYLFRFNLITTNLITLFVMGISSIGVAQALLAKRKIVCACLGAVFKIPMTKVTLMEDILMFVMALGMLILFK